MRILTFMILSSCITNVTSFMASFMSSRRHFMKSPNRGSSSLLLSLGPDADANKVEDLELTRQIILNYINRKEKEQGHMTEDDEQEEATSTESTHENMNLAGYLQRPVNDNMIRVAFGEKTKQTPIWLFRQAGRHLPEYHTYKGTKSFLDLLANPEDVAECTLQPVRRYPLDAAILFSDILVIVEALNIPVTMPGGVGIQVPSPLSDPDDMKRRLYQISMTPTEAKQFVQTQLKHVLDAVRLIRYKMKEENIQIPLIGFSAAPWTLLYYMVGGSSKKNTDIGMKWLTDYSDDSKQLLQLLTTIIIEYVSLQIENGAHMIQIFEAMGMMISDDLFEQYALPCLEQIGKEMKQRYSERIPIMIFTRGKCNQRILQKVVQLQCYDVITLDGTIERTEIRNIVGNAITIQGNYDPAELIESNDRTIHTVQESAQLYLQQLGPHQLIANLGEGLGGKESTDLVNTFIHAIHDMSTTMINAAATTTTATTTQDTSVAATTR